jgi:hypothetical protein
VLRVNNYGFTPELNLRIKEGANRACDVTPKEQRGTPQLNRLRGKASIVF